MTHDAFPKDLGEADRLVRLSVVLEPVEDLWEDSDQPIRKI